MNVPRWIQGLFKRKPKETKPANEGPWMKVLHYYGMRRKGFSIPCMEVQQYMGISLRDEIEVVGVHVTDWLKYEGLIPESAIIQMVDIPVTRWCLQLVYEDVSFEQLSDGEMIPFEHLRLQKFMGPKK